MSKRGGAAFRPPKTNEWRIRLATSEAAKGWNELSRQVPGQVASLHDRLTYDPRHVDNPQRQGRLKGTIGTVTANGAAFDQWQYEFTGGGRVWYFADHDKHTVWITMASTGHPKATD